ncbi:1-acyl-sn-glycerol-3-phosphate acyltransferase [Rhodopseudomonas boonkerdii]|uniref:lysophospholipid acyltransferase family protein n=1 Tax=Rhodopseudomonas boonkerdii TaxID=475937 RepID=UPI001E5F1E0A|nr:lysophospholipid acyltransferase family protein [Rhodopseudomonas boonkerdii]UGV25450.1 1-acyl-sn-glycerol-3-phosphate acyltransferase [Rhodopseudomonas boonkerdii]
MIRLVAVALTMFTMIVLLAPLQLISIAFGWRLQQVIPHIFHTVLCAVIGIRIHEVGERSRTAPLLILANHASWLDILVIGAKTPVVFVAKSEIAKWPLFGWLARMQRTIFVERERRQSTGATAREIGDRMVSGDAVVLFAEGTSSDGIRVLPFRSALVGSVHHALGESMHHDEVVVQPMSLAYVGFGGLPVGRALHQRIAWYGDVDLIPHLVGILTSGAIDVTVTWGEAVAYDISADRKRIARDAENAVRQMTTAALRAGPPKKVQTAPATEAAPAIA